MFKESFKYYKAKTSLPNLSDVIDFKTQCLPNNNYITSECDEEIIADFGKLLKPKQFWNVYELPKHPGLIFLENPFTSLGQRYWIVRCLRDFPGKPNKTNLDNTTNNNLQHLCNWPTEWYLEKNKILTNKLRWVTFGYQHNWDTKHYSEEYKSEFPLDLSNLIRFIAASLGFMQFRAEAAIVNFYHMKSTLSGHVDNSEQNLDAPLFSLSFGQSAIFLLGGTTLEELPTPILIRSGDIVVMSGTSRLCYHGVPKILEGKNQDWSSFNEFHSSFESDVLEPNILNICQDKDGFGPYNRYLDYSRINMNVRQVHKNAVDCKYS